MSRTTASDRALEELRRLIMVEDIGPGARLPTERELSQRLAINRASLRKALTRLEIEGAIVRQVGRGTFVATPSQRPESLAAGASPVELMEARLALEPVVAREAALRARQRDLERLRLCLARLEAADAFEDFEEWDVAFHKAVSDATQNPVFGATMEMLRQMRSTPDWDRLKRASFAPELRDRYRAEHRAIYDALVARDQASTANAMFEHMQTVREAIAGSVRLRFGSRSPDQTGTPQTADGESAR